MQTKEKKMEEGKNLTKEMEGGKWNGHGHGGNTYRRGNKLHWKGGTRGMVTKGNK